MYEHKTLFVGLGHGCLKVSVLVLVRVCVCGLGHGGGTQISWDVVEVPRLVGGRDRDKMSKCGYPGESLRYFLKRLCKLPGRVREAHPAAVFPGKPGVECFPIAM